jgi:hypothetical protein
MQANQELDEETIKLVTRDWRIAADTAISWAKTLLNEGVHKQITNRLLEPFMWHTAVVTATEWSNFFNLRCNKDAQPEIRKIAEMMRETHQSSQPRVISDNEWHLPFVDFDDEVNPQIARWQMSEPGAPTYLSKVSAGRSARVSYLTHDGRRDFTDDIALYDKLSTAGHMSPLEHPCRPMTEDELDMFCHAEYKWNGTKFYNTGAFTHFLGNVQGWVQLRKMMPNESDALK